MIKEIGYTGSVYLLRYTGVDAVKIGMTNDLNAMQRVNAYRTYAPFGLEVICIIYCFNPAKIEKEIHKLYADKRLNGEWFKLSKEDCDFIDNKYTDKFTRDLKNDIEIEFMKRVKPKSSKDVSEELMIIADVYSVSKTELHTKMVIVNNGDIIRDNDLTNLSSKDISEYMTSIGAVYRANRIINEVKKGYKLYKRK